MTTIFLTMALLLICVFFLCVGVIFFGKAAERSQCGTVPEAVHEDCPSQKAGICPVEDKTGALKLAKRSKISY